MYIIFVTEIQACGPFLKVYGQMNKEQAIQIELSLINVAPIANANPQPELYELQPGTLCLGRYKDGNYYRSRVLFAHPDDTVQLYFVDFGNVERLPIAEIRTIPPDNSPDALNLLRSAPQASEFILGRVIGDWNPKNLELIRKEICNETVVINEEKQLENVTLIGITFQGIDLSSHLYSEYPFSRPIPLDLQIEEMSRNVNAKRNETTPRSISKKSVTPQQRIDMQQQSGGDNRRPVQGNQRPASNVGARLDYSNLNSPATTVVAAAVNAGAAVTAAGAPVQIGRPIKASLPQMSPHHEIATFKSNTLAVDSIHTVYVSHVEDGPNLFCVQLKSLEAELNVLMDQLQRVTTVRLREKPIVGMACIARYSVDRQLYRAVIMQIMPNSCLVSFVDYGNAERVSHTDIFEILSEYLGPKTFGLRFRLSGYKGDEAATPDNIKLFNLLVVDRELQMRVTPLEGPPFVQYCELSVAGESILRSIAETSLRFGKSVVLSAGSERYEVIIRFVDTPQRFFVHMLSNIEAFDSLMDKLMIHCGKAPPLSDIRPGVACATQFNEELDWYRAEIVKVQSADCIDVRYVDFGNTATVRAAALRQLTPKIVSINPFAIECCLSGFEDATKFNANSRVQLEMFAETADQRRRSLQMQVINAMDTRYLVTLYDGSLNIAKRVYELSMPQSVVRQKHSIGKNSSEPVGDVQKKSDKEEVADTLSHRLSWQERKVSPPHANSHRNSEERTPNYEPKRNATENSYARNYSEEKERNYQPKHNSFENKPTRSGVQDRLRKYETQEHRSLNRDNYDNDTEDSYKSSNRNYEDSNSSSRQQRGHNNYSHSNSSVSSYGSGVGASPGGGAGAGDDGKYSRNSREKTQFTEPPKNVPLETPFNSFAVQQNEKISGVVSWWISPHEFFVQKEAEKEKFSEQMRQLQGFYRGRSSIDEKPPVGSTVAARYPKDGAIYRAKVIDYNANLERYKVEYVDFGNQAVISQIDIWKLDCRFHEFPRMAIQCSLGHVVVNNEQTCLRSQLDRYLIPGRTILCTFLQKDNDYYSVDIDVAGSNLKESLERDNFISSLPADFELPRLKGQTLIAQISQIFDLHAFRIKIDGSDVPLMCSFVDVKGAKQNARLSAEFRSWELKYCPFHIDDVSKDNILLVTPLIPLFGNRVPASIPEFPFLSGQFEVQVTHVESSISMYVQKANALSELADFLEALFSFYETGGKCLGRESCVPSVFCAAKSSDGNWYRGEIVSATESLVNIRFIDYGNTELIDFVALKVLEPQFTGRSVFAARVFLPISCKPPTDIETVINEIKNLTGDHVLTLEVLEYYQNQWIADIKSNAYSLIDVLRDKGIGMRADQFEFYEKISLEKNAIAAKRKTMTNSVAAPLPDQVSVPIPVPRPIEGETASGERVAVTNVVTVPRALTRPARLVHSDGPDRFYLQFETDFDRFGKLQQNLQIVAPSLPAVETFAEELQCIAVSSQDQQWYRAHVVDFDAEIVTLQFIDTGRTEVFTQTTPQSIKTMQDPFSREQALATKCSLPVIAATDDWSNEACALLEKLVLVECAVEMVARVGSTEYVRLYGKDGSEMSSRLVRDKLARQIEVLTSGEKCFISHTNSLDDFYIQLDSDTTKLELIADYLLDETRFPILNVSNAQVGTVCIAQFPDDLVWYRARVVECDEKSSTVLFLDYGNTSIVAALRQLPMEITDLPALSKRCALKRPEYLAAWSQQAEDKFQELGDLGATVFTLELVNAGDPSMIELFTDGKNIVDRLEPLCAGTVIAQSSSENVRELVTDLTAQEVGISHFESLSHFYVHNLAKATEPLNEMTNALATSDQLAPVEERREGLLCAAQSSDGYFYRALLKSIDGDVFFVDYGNTEVSSNLRQLPTELVSVEPLAQRCSLSHPSGGQWSSAAQKYFNNCFVGDSNTFQMYECADGGVRLLYNGRNINEELARIVEMGVTTEQKEKDKHTNSPDRQAVHEQNLETVAAKNEEVGAMIIEEIIDRSLNEHDATVSAAAKNEEVGAMIIEEIIDRSLNEHDATVSVAVIKEEVVTEPMKNEPADAELGTEEPAQKVSDTNGKTESTLTMEVMTEREDNGGIGEAECAERAVQDATPLLDDIIEKAVKIDRERVCKSIVCDLVDEAAAMKGETAALVEDEKSFESNPVEVKLNVPK